MEEKRLSLRELEKRSQETDGTILSIEEMLAESGTILDSIEEILEKNEKDNTDRQNLLKDELAKEKEAGRTSLAALRKAKEETEAMLRHQNDEAKKEADLKYSNLERSFKEKENDYRDKQAELEIRLHELDDLRLKTRLREKSNENLKIELQERLKGLLERINLLLKEEKSE